jgi:hypothetical protein
MAGVKRRTSRSAFMVASIILDQVFDACSFLWRKGVPITPGWHII